MLAASALLGALSYLTWKELDSALGDAFLAQAVSVLSGIAVGSAAYIGAVWALRVPEARQIPRLLVNRGRSDG
jgi:hypothetical protein